jgi:uncharacterized membrane protein YfcA
VVLGVWIFHHLTHAWMDIVMGLILIGIIIVDAVLPPQNIHRMTTRWPKSGAVFMATLSGIINGLVGAGALIFISVYIKSLYDEARRFRATLLLVAVLLSFWRFTVQYVKGIITVSLIYESLVLLPAALLGTWLGMRLFKSFPSSRYFRAFQIFLVLLALSVVLRSMVAMI